jgi:hypothetical protein
VLSIRESELTSRLQASDRRVAQLELELVTVTTLLRKEQASRLAAERRGRAPQPTAAKARMKARAKSRKPPTRSTPTRTNRPRTVEVKRR